MSHPLLVFILIFEIAADIAAAVWGLGAFKVLVRTASPNTAHTGLERLDDAARLCGRAADVCWTVSFFFFVLATASVLPGLIPGTMCGTGVLHAMAGAGVAVLLSRTVLLALFGAWHTLRRFDESKPSADLRENLARISLVTLTVGAVSSWKTFQSVFYLDMNTVQDCCAAVRRAGSLDRLFEIPDALIAIGCFVTAGLLFLSLIAVSTRKSPPRRGSIFVLPLALVFAPLSVLTVINVFSPYHFGSLSHHCGFCLFALRHKAAGYPLAFALILLIREATAFEVARRHFTTDALASDAVRSAKSAARRMILAEVVFIAGAVLPALVWRIRYGVFLGD